LLRLRIRSEYPSKSIQCRDHSPTKSRTPPTPSSLAIKGANSCRRKIDPTRVIYQLDITRRGFSRSQKTFNPADISSFYVSRADIPDSSAEGERGYKSLDDVREGFVTIEGWVKVTGPEEFGRHMGTVEFSAVINVETQKIVLVRKNRLRVMGRKIED
jgi:hypothetical protein